MWWKYNGISMEDNSLNKHVTGYKVRRVVEVKIKKIEEGSTMSKATTLQWSLFPQIEKDKVVVINRECPDLA